jgi:hypothetical protein
MHQPMQSGVLRVLQVRTVADSTDQQCQTGWAKLNQDGAPHAMTTHYQQLLA